MEVKAQKKTREGAGWDGEAKSLVEDGIQGLGEG